MYVWVPEVGNTADTPNLPWVLPLLKEIWESPRVNENLTSVGFEPTTSGLDLPMLYRLSYEAAGIAVNDIDTCRVAQSPIRLTQD